MFCCVRTRGRKERKADGNQLPEPIKPKPLPAYGGGYVEDKGTKGVKDGNMAVLAGAGVAVVAATAVTTAVVVAESNGSGVGDTDGGGGCCCGGGGGCGGGGCGGGCGG